MTIYIGNLSFDAEVEDIVGVFSSYGEVTNCKLPLERETGRKRGFAFVDMGDETQEQKELDGSAETVDNCANAQRRVPSTRDGIRVGGRLG